MNITYRRDYIPPPARTGVDSDLIYELNYYNDRKDDASRIMNLKKTLRDAFAIFLSKKDGIILVFDHKY